MQWLMLRQWQCSFIDEMTHIRERPGQNPVKATDMSDWVLEQEAEEAESDRTVWDSGPSVPGWDPSADWLHASERRLPRPWAR